MNVAFKHISLTNFCNIKEFDADFHDKTIIAGFNREGKSTIRNAIYFVLTDKLADNSAAGDSIRPHDENGNRIDNVDISVSLTVSVDGTDYILTKTQRQKWVKKRGTEDREFQGNENLYEISGVPKKAKDFEQFINDNICPIADLPFCINPNAFLSLDAKKRRAKVLGLSKAITDDDVIATNPEFESLRGDLKVGTFEELVKKHKSTITTLKKSQVEIPTRIDEISRSIVEYDFSALDLEKNSLNEQLADIQKKEEEIAGINADIYEKEHELASIERDLNSEVKEQRGEIMLSVSDIKSNLRIATDDLARLESDKENAKILISNNEKALVEAEKQQELVSSKVFDGSSLICPNCHQPYPKEKEADIRAEFDRQRVEEMDRLSDYINTLKSGKNAAEEKIAALEGKITDTQKVIEAYKKDISEKEIQAAGLILADPTKDGRYIAKMDEIAALKARLADTSFDAQKAEIKANIVDVERKLAQADANNRAEDRIGQLRNELKAVGQNILKEEHMLYLLEEFNKARIGMLEDSVNSFFDIIKWRFYEAQINGGYSEVCRATVNGTSYDGLLNKSDRILCQLDLCKGFMKAAGVSLPLLADDMESVDSNRIPSFENQMILFKREDCKLSVRSE